MNKFITGSIKTPGRILELDGLRGVAILLVISFHYINNQLIHSTNKLGIILSKLTSFGWVGVDLFFVLSGFLITSILIRNKGSNNYFLTFYIRRFVRIVPNYYLLIFIFIIVLSGPWFNDNYFLTGNNIIPTWAYFIMVHNFYMAVLNNLGNAAMSVTWSIGIEEQFYIIFPFIVYFIKDLWLPIILVIAIVLTSFLRSGYQHWIPPYVLLPCRMDSISFGALVAWINCHYELRLLAKKYFLLLMGIVGIVIVICAFKFIKYNDLGASRNSMFALVFAISLIFALTSKNSWYSNLLRNRLLVWIGTISYSLYLFHYLILGIFQHVLGNREGVGINTIQDILFSILALITSILFSWGVFKLLETPFVLWGKRFKY